MCLTISVFILFIYYSRDPSGVSNCSEKCFVTNQCDEMVIVTKGISKTHLNSAFGFDFTGSGIGIQQIQVI